MQVAAGSLSAVVAEAFAGSLLEAAVEVDSAAAYAGGLFAAAVKQSQLAAAAAVGKLLAVVEGSVEIVESFV